MNKMKLYRLTYGSTDIVLTEAAVAALELRGWTKPEGATVVEVDDPHQLLAVWQGPVIAEEDVTNFVPAPAASVPEARVSEVSKLELAMERAREITHRSQQRARVLAAQHKRLRRNAKPYAVDEVNDKRLAQAEKRARRQAAWGKAHGGDDGQG